MSFICKDCGAVFASPDTVLMHGDVWETSICPNCGSQEYERAYTCAICGADIPESQDLFHLCHDCEFKAAEKFQRFLNQFSENELNYLSWKWEGEEFTKKEIDNEHL